jgi:hypothetical protein
VTIGLAVAALVLQLSGRGAAEPTWRGWAEAPRVAVLLFSNYTGTSIAVDAVMPRVYDELDARRADYRTHDELRPVLRAHRIRAASGIGPEDARTLREETGAGLLLLGTLDILEPDGILEAGVSARIVEIEGMRVIAAESAAATGEDFAGLFGVGRVVSVDELAARVVRELFEGLDRSFARTAAPDSGAPRVAIVPLDDKSDRGHAGDAFSSILASELLRGGFDVVEPGIVHGLGLESGSMRWGEVDHPTLERFAEVLDADFVVTGEVAEFQPARGEVEHAAPSLALGARLVDARARRLVLSWDDARGGRDGEHVLGLGRVWSLGRLARDAAARFVSRIARETPGELAGIGSEQ